MIRPIVFLLMGLSVWLFSLNNLGFNIWLFLFIVIYVFYMILEIKREYNFIKMEKSK